MYNNSLITIEDLTNEEIEDVLDLAEEMNKNQRNYPNLAAGHIMASLFFESSTRTRGSFESAMMRMGGNTITTSDVKSSSLEKGESLADTIRVWSSYADLIVMRHPWEGAARLGADYAQVPVINAGDGGHEHPTQTLCDLFTLRVERKTLNGLKVAICGDLKNGRTVHSLIFGLLRFGAELYFVPGEGLGLPTHIKAKIETQYQRPIEKIPAGDFKALYGSTPGDPGNLKALDAIYVTPSKPHLDTFSEDAEGFSLNLSNSKSMVFYVTRMQHERESGQSNSGKPTAGYPRISQAALKKGFSRSIVLHPLPRVDELSPDMDSDQRSRYFIQAGYGVPVRMALLSLALKLRPWRKAADTTGSYQTWRSPLATVKGIECRNASCVTTSEPLSCDLRFQVQTEPYFRFVCLYCEQEIRPVVYGLQQSGVKLYQPVSNMRYKSQHQLHQFRFFTSEAEAKSEGFLRSTFRSSDSPSVFEVSN